MCSVNFHTVTPCLLNTKGCFSKLAYDNLQLFNCNRTGSFFCIGRSHIGRGNQTWCAWNRECHIGRVKQLWKDLGTILMHCICKLLPPGDKGIIVNRHIPGQIDVGRLHSCHLGNNQADTSLGSGLIMLYKLIRNIALICQICRNRRHKHTIFDGCMPYFNW